MEAFLGISGVFLVLALFGILSRIEAVRRRRMIEDVTRSPSSTSTRTFQLSGDLLPREETSLGPVDYRRIPTAQPVGYIQTTQRAQHAPTIEASVMVPIMTALCTTVALTLGALVLAVAFGWALRVVALTFAVALVGSWLWRLGFADKVLWSVESWTGKDLDHDHNIGNPAVQFAVVNPARARASVAQQSAQNDTEARQHALAAFVDTCFLHGCSEAAHSVKAGSGPDREAYTACRDTLMRLGLAAWRNPSRPKAGWMMVADPATTKSILSNHVA